MTPEREAQMRAAFEKWRKDLIGNPDLTKDAEGYYEDWDTQVAWSGFLACARALEPTWQPIETAPRDGTRILLGNKHGVWIGIYKPVYTSGYRPSNPWASMMLNHEHMAVCDTRPTHWVPLPEQPKAAMSAALEDGNATE